MAPRGTSILSMVMRSRLFSTKSVSRDSMRSLLVSRRVLNSNRFCSSVDSAGFLTTWWLFIDIECQSYGSMECRKEPKNPTALKRERSEEHKYEITSRGILL